jgi:hypothetical protein
MVPTLTYGLSHKIPNGTSVTSGLSQYNTVISSITSQDGNGAGRGGAGEVPSVPALILELQSPPRPRTENQGKN